MITIGPQLIELLDNINKYVPVITAFVIFIFSFLVYRLKDTFKQEFTTMRHAIEKDIKEYIDKKFTEHENAELKDALQRKQKYINDLERKIESSG
jgi:hypothetical protein